MEKLPKYQHLGMTIVINFDESEVKTEDGIRYEYTTARVSKTSSRNERIEAIIKTKYPTYGAEFAAIHKGGEHEFEYDLLRKKAKQLADESFIA